MVIIAVLLVADVGVRRVRISAPELRAGYGALRRRLGYIDERPGLATRPFVLASPRRDGPVPTVGLVTALHPTVGGVRSRTPAGTTQSGRLLAAKRRASRR